MLNFPVTNTICDGNKVTGFLVTDLPSQKVLVTGSTTFGDGSPPSPKVLVDVVIKAWSTRFAIPALCTLLAALLFVSGSRSYRDYCRPSQKGSLVMVVFRVFVASTLKMFKQFPENEVELHGNDDKSFQRLPNHGLRFLDKAAIISTIKSKEEQEKNKWTLCKVEEVEAAKRIIHIAPICITFIICGVVLSIGNTYFIEQANHLDRKVGRLSVPLALFLAFYELAKTSASNRYTNFVRQPAEEIKKLSEDEQKKREVELKKTERQMGIWVPIVVTFLIYIYIQLSCITAAKVEQRRLNTIRKHGLLDKPEERIPMSIFWLLPQFLLIASAEGFYKSSVTHFFAYHLPWCMYEYRSFFHKAVMGLGSMGSVLMVFIVGKVSEMGGKPNWFQYTLNESRLDRYYWTLAVLCAVNLIIYSFAICFYDFKLLALEEPEGQDSAADLFEEEEEG